jgi:hypothetical protein
VGGPEQQKLADISQIHQSLAETPLLVVDWPRGVMVTVCEVRGNTANGSVVAHRVPFEDNLP